MIGEAYIWAIFLLPLGSFAAISLIIGPFFKRWPLLSGLALILPLAVAVGLSVWVLRSVALGHDLEFASYEWLDVGAATIELGLLTDQLTAIMLIVVTGVSLAVQVYSLGYMRGDNGYSRYFAYMSLFTASMVGLVLSANIIQLYVFWELVGASSYLLIGFWHERPAAAAAAKKAFIVTRIGDVGFLIAILYLFFKADDFAAAGLNAFHIPDIWLAAQPLAIGGAGILGGMALTWFALGIFAGAAGKSGQFPLHSWLPDAMEGPTPVSALIHAATMVAAGVFLVARFYPVFQQTGDALAIIALVGAFTAFMAATMGLVNNDIKRVMAYSTISQLGYMMAGLGVGAYGPAIFHLFTHASFKALLFLGAGSVNHATGTFDMRYMGGLRRVMPWTYLLTVIGGLSLVGIIPLAGFWSKDEILVGVWTGAGLVEPRVGQVTFGLLLAGVVLTGFYTFRMIHRTFHGEFRGGVDKEMEERDKPEQDGAGHGGGVHLAESPVVMVAPMIVLGLAAVVSGYLANPQWDKEIGIQGHWINEFLLEGLEHSVPELAGHFEVHDFSRWMAVISTGAAVGGLAVAGLLYGLLRAGSKEPPWVIRPVHTLLTHKYYVDALYEGVVVRRGFYRAFAGAIDWLDRNVVDAAVDSLGWISRTAGAAIGRMQTGQVQVYGSFVLLGTLAIILAFYLTWKI